MGKSIFVTVGSTSFDDLSLAVLDPDLLRCLADLSYTHLTLQHGRLSILLPDASSFASDLTVAKFDYSADILKEIEHADLVISHAGAGTVLEVLKWHKRLIVVANETLMDNHQLELAKKLVKEGYCLSSVPEPKYGASKF